MIIIIPLTYTMGSILGSVVVLIVVVDTKIAKSGDLGT